MGPQLHLYDVPDRREAETIRRLVGPAGPPGELGQIFGFHQFGWIGLGLPTSNICDTVTPHAPGDIDILGGPFTCSDNDAHRAAVTAANGNSYLAGLHLLVHGGLDWPPTLSYLAGIEAKAARCEARGRTRRRSLGEQTQAEARGQALGLCELGLDRVALARIVVSPPISARAGSSWMAAGAVASVAADRYAQSVIVHPDDPFETIVLSLGAVAHATEDVAGSFSCHARANVGPNPLRLLPAPVQARSALEARLHDVFLQGPMPKAAPLFILACAKTKRCGRLYVTGTVDARCPSCDGRSTLMPE